MNKTIEVHPLYIGFFLLFILICGVIKEADDEMVELKREKAFLCTLIEQKHIICH